MIDIRKRKSHVPNLVFWDIFITRGDSGYIDFDLTNEDGSPIDLENAVVRCQVREAPNDGVLLFDGIVEIDGTKATWHIVPENTKTAPHDDYYWDVQVEYANGDVFTFVPYSYFKIMPEVTKRAEGGD